MTTDLEDKQAEGAGQTEGVNSYKSILKGTSIFGGVQIFNILINLVRGKFVAIILGPEGMGITALFNSASNTIQRFASLGLNQSIVKDVAEKNMADVERLRVVDTCLRLTNLTALLGFVICAGLCFPLSNLTFGDFSYWWQFIVLGLAVAFGISGAGKMSILQGLHQVKRISKASVVGGLAGLFIGIPLYYIFGFKGIVFAILAIFLSQYIFYSINLNKAYPDRLKNGENQEFKSIARKLLALGLVVMSGDIIGTLVTYLINLFLRKFGDLDEVGLYQAANSITTQFAGMIFAALAIDYFPRLSAVAKDNAKMIDTVNRQSEVVALLITPAMSLLILSAPLLIRVLLTESFHTIIPLMRWMGFGILLRGLAFPMAYITFAKGNKKVFFLLEGLLGNIFKLTLSCLFFYWFGIIGLGYALVADNGLFILIYYIVNRRLYGYTFSRKSFINYLGGLVLVGSCFIFSFLHSEALSYSLMGVAAALSVYLSLRELRLLLFKKKEGTE